MNLLKTFLFEWMEGIFIRKTISKNVFNYKNAIRLLKDNKISYTRNR
jgi:hypothetical protein